MEQLDPILAQIGRAYGDWLEFWWKPLPPQSESKAEEITIQFEKLCSDMSAFIKQIQEVSRE